MYWVKHNICPQNVMEWKFNVAVGLVITSSF